MPANGLHGAAIQLIEMHEEIMGQGAGLPAGITAAGLYRPAINLVAGEFDAPLAAAKKRWFGPEPLFVAHIAAGWDRLLSQR